MLSDEMDKKLPKKDITSLVTRPKSKYKPYWCKELQEAWDIVCLKERTWLRSRGSQSEKRRLRDSFNQERKNFDKLNRHAKRKYQISEQERLKELYCDNDTRNFWKYIRRIGLHKDRKPKIPMEVVNTNGHVSTNTTDVLLRWKTDYENLFSDMPNSNFDEDHLRYVKNSLDRNSIPRINIDVSSLNAEITKAEVQQSVFRVRLRKAAGLDNIPAEVLRNPACVESLFKIIRYCFIDCRPDGHTLPPP